MNWSKAKNVMIALFLIINIYLLYHLISIYNQNAVIDKETVQDVITILASNGIEIEEADIMRRTPEMQSVTLQNAVSDYKSFAKSVLGEEASASANTYVSGTKTLSFNADTIIYQDTSSEVKMNRLSEEDAKTEAVDLLKSWGIDTSRISTATYREETGNYIVEVSPFIGKYAVFDCGFTVTVSQTGVSAVSGSWFSDPESMGYETPAVRIKPISGILIDFISEYKTTHSEGGKIDKIELGYTTGEKNSYHKSVSAIPTWCICTDDGSRYYFDAI